MPDRTANNRLPVTPDGRYFLAGGKLWRRADPRLDDEQRLRLLFDLIAARSDALHARRQSDEPAHIAALARVDAAKRALGQRGAPWWSDGAPDLTSQNADATAYARWARARRVPER